MVRFDDIYKTLNTHLGGIVDASYPKDRPESVQDKVQSFIVISMPSMIDMPLVGSNDYNTDLEIEVFVRDKNTKASPNLIRLETIENKMQLLFDKFPYRFTDFKVGKPKIMFHGKDDGKGFHYSLIQAQITTFVNK